MLSDDCMYYYMFNYFVQKVYETNKVMFSCAYAHTSTRIHLSYSYFTPNQIFEYAKFRENKSSQNEEITMSLTDVGKSWHRCEILM